MKSENHMAKLPRSLMQDWFTQKAVAAEDSHYQLKPTFGYYLR